MTSRLPNIYRTISSKVHNAPCTSYISRISHISYSDCKKNLNKDKNIDKIKNTDKKPDRKITIYPS